MYEANCAIKLNRPVFSKEKRTQFFEIVLEEKRREFARLANDHGEESTNSREREKKR